MRSILKHTQFKFTLCQGLCSVKRSKIDSIETNRKPTKHNHTELTKKSLKCTQWHQPNIAFFCYRSMSESVFSSTPIYRLSIVCSAVMATFTLHKSIHQNTLYTIWIDVCFFLVFVWFYLVFFSFWSVFFLVFWYFLAPRRSSVLFYFGFVVIFLCALSAKMYIE